MRTTINIIQLGIGGVGRALIEQVLATQAAQTRYGIHLRYVAIVDSNGVVANPHGLDEAVVRELGAWKAEGNLLKDYGIGTIYLSHNEWLAQLIAPATIIVDTTAAEGAMVLPAFEGVLAQGGAVVLANKKPIAESTEQWEILMRGGRTGYEATVGAGMPIISTLQNLIDTGDTIRHIQGTFSGTLGYLMSQLQEGTSYSQAVRTAKTNGWTEPDPRDDLGGIDIARKALILARTLGWHFELADVEVEPLYPAEWAGLNVADFMARLEELDNEMAAKVSTAHEAGQRLRYTATVTPSSLKVGLATVPPDGALGALKGSDNLIGFYTERYGTRPLVVQGAGAGTYLTASAVLADILRLGTNLRQV
jgi:homoserine dehydrogenase